MNFPQYSVPGCLQLDSIISAHGENILAQGQLHSE